MILIDFLSLKKRIRK